MAVPVLHYFTTRGRAEVTRQMLVSSGIEFEDRRFKDEEWFTVAKPSGFYEFNQIPLLEIDGQRLVTSHAIERYLAKKLNLYPEDNYQVYLVESLIDLKNDLFTPMGVFLFFTNDPQGLENWIVEVMPNKLKCIEARFEANESDSYLVGNFKTWADFAIAQFIHDTFMLPEQSHRLFVLEQNAPKLKAFTERFYKNDVSLSNYILTRPTTIL